jgi:hypothetical protein
MPILVNSKGERFTESDANNIYNAIKSGEYTLEPGSELTVRDPTGDPWSLDAKAGDINNQLTLALENGARFETAKETFERKYPELTGLGGSVLIGGASLLNTALFGAPAYITSQTLLPDDISLIKGAQESSPIASTIGSIGGYFTPTGIGDVISGTAGVVGKLLPEATSISGKLATSAVTGSAIGAVSAIPTAVTEASFGDPGKAADNFIAQIGSGTLLGAAINPVGDIITQGIMKLASPSLLDKSRKLINNVVSKDNNFTPEQQKVFDTLLEDPETRQQVSELNANVEKDAIASTIQNLGDLDTLLNKDVQEYYGKEFDGITSQVSAASAAEGSAKIQDLLFTAEQQILASPESYNKDFLKSIEAARNTLKLRGASQVRAAERASERYGVSGEPTASTPSAEPEVAPPRVSMEEVTNKTSELQDYVQGAASNIDMSIADIRQAAQSFGEGSIAPPTPVQIPEGMGKRAAKKLQSTAINPVDDFISKSTNKIDLLDQNVKDFTASLSDKATELQQKISSFSIQGIDEVAPKLTQSFMTTTTQKLDALNKDIRDFNTKIFNKMDVLRKDTREFTIKDKASQEVLQKKLEQFDMKSKGRVDAIQKDIRELSAKITNRFEGLQSDIKAFGNKSTMIAQERTLLPLEPPSIPQPPSLEEIYQKVIASRPDMAGMAAKAWERAKIKALKEARTQIGYKAGFGVARLSSDQTPQLAKQLYSDISDVVNQVYGQPFIKLSDTYTQARDALKDIKRSIVTGDNISAAKVKSLISNNPAKQLQLESLIAKVEELQGQIGQGTNLRARMDKTLFNVRARRMLQGKANPLIDSSMAAGAVGSAAIGSAVPAVGVGAYKLYQMLKNPKVALSFMSVLERGQAKISNTISAISRGTKYTGVKRPTLTGAFAGLAENKNDQVALSVQAYQKASDATRVQTGIENNLGELKVTAPNLLANSTGKLSQIAQFMVSKSPNISVDAFTQKPTIQDSQQKVDNFLIYEQAASNPLQALQDLVNMKNVSQNREVLQQLYPTIWSHYFNQTLQYLQGKEVDFSERRKYNTLLGAQDLNFSLPSVSNNILSASPEPRAHNKPAQNVDTTDTARLRRGD